MCHEPMCLGDSSGAGSTLSESTGLWQMTGLCTTILAKHPSCWNGGHEKVGASKEGREFCDWSRPWIAPSCARGAKGRARSRHSDLHLGERKSRREETVNTSGRAAVPGMCRAQIGCARNCALVRLGSGLASAASG